MLYLLLPLVSAILYPIGNLFLKRSIHEGGGLIRSLFVSNIILGICFLPLLGLINASPNWHQIHWPIFTGATYFFGQLFTMIAIRSGDVSVQTPLMGIKLLFVAAFSQVIKPDEVPPMLWLAAAISTIAIFLIGGGNVKAFRNSSRTVIFTLIACFFFGLTDTVNSYRSALFGRMPFLIVTAATVTILSFALIPFFNGRLRDMPRVSLKLMSIGGLAIGLQALILISTLSHFGQATAVNIVYSSRAIFGVLLVILLGAKLGNLEASIAAPGIMRNRLLGALLLSSAIILVFLKN